MIGSFSKMPRRVASAAAPATAAAAPVAPVPAANATTAVTKKDLGQFFTISDDLQKFVFDKVKNKGSLMLEPSFGRGHLLRKFLESDPNWPMRCYELDTGLRDAGVVTFNASQTVVWGDFTKQVFAEKFKTIVGNPPYVKQRSGNLYLKFIELCFGLLDDGGELIFIVPSDFIKLTSAAPVIKAMTAAGSFTDFLFPHDEKLFDGASVDVVVFRYERGLMSGVTTVNGLVKTCNVSDGIITFSDGLVAGTRLMDLFDVAVGFVSGKDEVYKVPIGNVEILSDQGKVDKFIVTEAYPSGLAAIDAHLLKNKALLLERKIKKFTEKNWWAWGALRNKTTVEAALGRACIYVRNITRQETVAFIDKVRYFGGGLLCLVPKKAMSAAELKRIVGFLNGADVRKDYLYSGRFKIGHKQVCNIMVPNA